jgi:hypothetical protein
MKARDVEKLAREHVLPVLPGFDARGALTYRRPVEHLLYGLAFETSAFGASRIEVIAFVQPLFVPDGSVVMNIGFSRPPALPPALRQLRFVSRFVSRFGWLAWFESLCQAASLVGSRVQKHESRI